VLNSEEARRLQGEARIQTRGSPRIPAKIGAKLTKMTPEQSKYLGVPQAGPFKAETYRY
jgi:hypothetical protein